MKTDYKDKLSEEDIKTLDEAIVAAKGKAEVTDKEELASAVKELTDKMMPIGSKMYEQAQKDAKPAEETAGENKGKKKPAKDEPIEGEIIDDKKEEK